MTKKYFKEISDSLNKNDREKYLFQCFAIPDDDVRLTLVNCILQVPLSELEIEEINYLMKAVSESKNIGAGKTEEIISTIFLIFINLVEDQNQLVSKNFRVKYCKEAISHCLEILLKNQKRRIEDKEEADEKLMLSIACLYFLKAASKSPEMAKKMEDDDLSWYFFENIYAEQNFTFVDHQLIPIELEITTLGSTFFNCREALFGSKAIKPWNFISFRVIQQIANILQNLDPLSINKLEKIPGEKKTDSMMRNLQVGLQKRIQQELLLWHDSRERDYMNYFE